MNSSHLSMNSRFAPQNSPSSGHVSSLKSCSSPSQHGRRLASCSTLWRSCTWKSLAACLRPPALSHCSISTYPVLEVKTCLDRDSNTDSFFFLATDFCPAFQTCLVLHSMPLYVILEQSSHTACCCLHVTPHASHGFR